MSLKNKTLFITGASRGIGLAIALRAARDGANIVIAAKSVKENPVIPGTIFSAAKEVENAGGKALPIECDVRSEEAIERAVAQAVAHFGGIDILINNASAISVTGTLITNAKKYDLMHSVCVRATYLTSRACIPHLEKSRGGGRILNISPPLSMKPKWFAPHVAYTMSKYGMSMCVLGMAEELREKGISVNALWPKTTIATAAVKNLLGGQEMADQSRNCEIMADAAHVVLTSDNEKVTGQFLIDEYVLRATGITNFDKYASVPGTKEFLDDFFLDEDNQWPMSEETKRALSLKAKL